MNRENPDLAALIFVDATTGMRRGEICGLRFCDVDFEAGAASVWWRCSDLPKGQTAVVEGKGNVVKVFPTGVVMLSASKNKKRRRFALDPVTLAVLLEQKARAEARCEEPWRPDRVSGASTALRNREKMPHVCLNDLRHFSATQLLAGGVAPRLVAGRLGHDVSVLLRLYSHVIAARDETAARSRLLGELMSGRDLLRSLPGGGTKK